MKRFLIALVFVGIGFSQNCVKWPSDKSLPGYGVPCGNDANPTVWNQDPQTFLFSVVPGGMWSNNQVAAARELPGVKDHYEDLGPLAIAQLRTSKQFYDSYQKDGKFYWTSRKVTIPVKEFVWVDAKGQFVRARCGNRLSEVEQFPELPVSLAPTPAMLDTAEVPKTETKTIANKPQTLLASLEKKPITKDQTCPAESGETLCISKSAPLIEGFNLFPVIIGGGGYIVGSENGGVVGGVGGAGLIQSSLPGGVAAPEPGSLGLLLLGLVVFAGIWKIVDFVFGKEREKE